MWIMGMAGKASWSILKKLLELNSNMTKTCITQSECILVEDTIGRRETMRCSTLEWLL